jgi:DNA-binding winged helix-turn-helix (wHTH) protein
VSTTDFPREAFPEAPVRAADLQYIVDRVRKGECCSVVGPSNTGKSLLLKSLLTEPVRQRCAQKGVALPIAVFVDCLEAADSEQALYELLLRCILEALEASGAPGPTVNALRTLYAAVIDDTTDVAIRSTFARSVRQLMREAQTALIVILDEFDDIFRAISPWPLRQLRVLRDRYGSRLCYVVGTSRDLARLRSDPDTYEFRELFQPYTRMLRPLHVADAERFVAYLSRRREDLPSQERVELIVELSGGHPGLMERIYDLLPGVHRGPATPLQDAVAGLSRQRAIQEECRRLWNELEEEEREGLLAQIRGDELATGTRQRQGLEAKGLVVVREAGGLAIFSPVFEEFVRQELGKERQIARRGLWYDAETRQIWLDGKDITRELSADQYALLAFMCQRPGVVCTKDELAQAVWPDQAQEGITDAQIYQLLKRVRDKIETDPINPRYLVTVRGQGYRLETPPD